MHALLPAETRRRTLFLAAVIAVAVLGLAFPVKANAAGGTNAGGAVSVVITSMNPQFARPGSTVTLTGTVRNGTSQARTGLEIRLYTSAAPFHIRDEMDAYLAHNGTASPEAVGSPFVLGAALQPGATATWKASFAVGAAGIGSFGVYPLAAQAQDAAGDPPASARTLLPYWPGTAQAAGLARPLYIAWAWPLIDQPRHQACGTLADNSLAASLGPGGRLATLIAVGQAHKDADLTWFVDPALLDDMAAMTGSYQVGSKPDCTGSNPHPASKTAVQRLSALRTITSQQQTVITPYADVDVAALVHRGLNADMISAFTLGEAVAKQVLHGTFGPSIAWPAGGTADLSVLTSLAASEHVGTVVLSNSQMKPKSSAVFTDDAVASIRTGTGAKMNVLLADDTLTGVLRAGSTGTRVPPPGAEFAVRQQFLAETAMIAAQAPNSDRSVVVAPPADWSPTAALADSLLSETADTPWLSPATLAGLTTARDTGRTISRQPPPASKPSPGELSGGYLNRVRSAGAALGVYRSVLYQPDPGYLRQLSSALAVTESAAWRGHGAAHGAAALRGLSAYLGSALSKVKIIASAQVTMGGTSGRVPVSIQNDLLRQAVQVRLNTSVPAAPNRTSQLAIGRFQNVVVIQPQQSVSLKLPVSSAPQGPTTIHLSLSSATGTPLPATAQLTVESTRYGRAILFLIGAAIGVLVLTSVYRGLRRWLRGGAHAAGEKADGHAVGENGEAPGSVVAGTTAARHQTEAPDDLAEARRRADDP